MARSFDDGSSADTAPLLSNWPNVASPGFRRHESTVLIGHGNEVWERVKYDVLRWEVKTRSGFTVADARRVVPGAETTITARVAGITVREPVRVHAVVEEATRVGFSYRTLPGHPVSGEEAFIVFRDADEVLLTVRSLTRPADVLPWRALYPVLRVAQVVARRRYLRALR